MGDFETHDIDFGARFAYRDLSRLKQGTKAIVTYLPSSDEDGEGIIRCVGRIEAVKKLERSVVFRFYEPTDQISVQVHIGQTVADSTVLHKGEDIMCPQGNLIRLRLFEDVESQTEMMLKAIDEYESGRFETAALAADIDMNRHILRWLNWSSNAA
jgi:hypothetical protein